MIVVAMIRSEGGSGHPFALVLKIPPRGSIASWRHKSASKLTENVE